MASRAESAERTKQRIRAAAASQLRARLRSDIRLDDIAADAGVTVQTVLRVHGSKAELFRVAFEDLVAEMRDGFTHVEPGEIGAAVRAWFDHYEEFGGVVLISLADEHLPEVAPIVATGRRRHRQWVETVLAPQLRQVATADRGRVLDALVCATDVYFWKLLRRDMGRSRDEAEDTMEHTIRALLGAG
ncbi:MAG: TetR/AcrR family transcriptional regulator [Nocardioides sp.]|uniref:TetR/AcrR family transcriptional regulator n=1 Tax=Nocardioides sp. TaxID=35761 RepID=UPI003D6A6377